MRHKSILFIILFVFIFFGLPNIINQHEESTFNRSKRLALIKDDASINSLGDSITTYISDFYKTSDIGQVILGKHHRLLWSTEVKLPVFTGFDTLEFVKTGGGQQTKSVELKNKEKKRYALRSINKDNSNALPSFFKGSIIRPFIRDQASALNPYSAPVVSQLLNVLKINHPRPIIYFIPFLGETDSVSLVLGGEVVTMVEELNKRWAGSPILNAPERILNTEAMFGLLDGGTMEIDTQTYLRCRLFDFIVSDWDRHSKQWKWGVYGNRIEPIPIDRDMAFCKFDDGWASKVVRLFNNKFQSYTNTDLNVQGLTKNSLKLDRTILNGVSQNSFLSEAQYLRLMFTNFEVQNAFMNYPPEIFELVGEEHISIFKNRLERLETTSLAFFELINEK